MTKPLADGLQQNLKYLPNTDACDEAGLYDCLMEQGYDAFGSGYAPWDDKVCAPKYGCDVKPTMEAMTNYLTNAPSAEAYEADAVRVVSDVEHEMNIQPEDSFEGALA